MTVIGPAASDGPLFVTATVAMPEVPGVSDGDEPVTARSALAGPTSSDDGAELLMDDGSTAGALTDTDPPARVAPGTLLAGSEIGTRITWLPPFTTGPLMTHVIGPTSAPVQPEGKLVTVVPVGGVYETEIGPALSDGPLFVIVIEALPLVPGTMVGVLMATPRSL